VSSGPTNTANIARAVFPQQFKILGSDKVTIWRGSLEQADKKFFTDKKNSQTKFLAFLIY